MKEEERGQPASQYKSLQWPAAVRVQCDFGGLANGGERQGQKENQREERVLAFHYEAKLWDYKRR